MVHDPRVSQTLARLGGLYREPARVDRDASSLLKSSVGSTLAPIAAQLVEDNGNSTNVLVLQGTIAIHFRGQTYQLLIDMYLPAGYPNRPPIAYVRLAENMYLKENHKHVGSDGKVYLPYLHEWNHTTHNLVELVVAMSSVFSAEPPVFSRPAGAVSPPRVSVPATNNYPMYQNQSSQAAAAVSSSLHSSSSTSAATAALLRQQDEQMQAALAASAAEEAARQSKIQEEQEKQRRSAQQKAWEEQRLNQVRETVRQKVVHYLQESAQLCQQQVAADQRDSQLLATAKEQKIDSQLQYFAKLQQTLERQCAVADECKQDIEAWLEAARAAADNGSAEKETAVDDKVVAATSVQAQMLQLSSENAALSDALYFLDRALYQGHLTVETHLRQVRKLAKKQFLVRAHLIKIQQVVINNSNHRS